MLGEREAGQQPEKQTPQHSPGARKKLWSIPRAKRLRSQGRRGCVDPAPATAPSSAHRTLGVSERIFREVGMRKAPLGTLMCPGVTPASPAPMLLARLRPPNSGRFSRAWKHKTSHGWCQGGGTGRKTRALSPRGDPQVGWHLPRDAPNPQLWTPLPKPLVPQELLVTSLCSVDSFGVCCRALGQELQ